MNDFESYFASLEEKIQKGSRLQVIKDANEENNRAYKVNRALLFWFKAEKIAPWFLLIVFVVAASFTSLFFLQNKTRASLKTDQSFLSLEYSYVDAIDDDFPWEKLELQGEKEGEIRSLVNDYLVKKNALVEKIEHLNSQLNEENKGDLELEISDLNYQLKLLSSKLSLKIRFLLDEEETHRFFRLCSALK
ncbi:MAG: hypothetical protein HRT47_02350 [Candidatus Caenarcaniphilales bacterium]|nr:hypothetical protein [Candidatus Caenarcaniphilales bacterium]